MTDASTGTKAFLAVGLVVFAASAVVQYNDPDPWRWVLIYGLAAVVCAAGLRRRLAWPAPVAVGLASLAWAGALAPKVLGKVGFGEMFESVQMHDVRVEQGREMGGLLIVAAWMAITLVLQQRR